MGFCVCSMFCGTLLCILSSFAIILVGKREDVALLYLSAWSAVCGFGISWSYSLAFLYGCITGLTGTHGGMWMYQSCLLDRAICSALPVAHAFTGYIEYTR